MQLVSCTVRLGGILTSTVDRTDVTVPELAVLGKIHGEGSVVNIRATHEVARSDGDERARLASIYASSPESSGTAIIKELFAGAFTRLPQTLADIGIKADGTPEPIAGKSAVAPLTQEELDRASRLTHEEAIAEIPRVETESSKVEAARVRRTLETPVAK